MIYGKPCWGVKNCVGSDITFEFGEPHLEIREPTAANPKSSKRVRDLFARRWVNVRGDWHLWIWMCSWEILQNGKRIGSNRTLKENMDRVVYSLNGQKLVHFSMDRRGGECKFEFDLGGVLATHSYSKSRSDRESDHWTLFLPSGRVLILRNNGMFSYHRSSRPARAGSWKPVSQPIEGERRE
jgi:hypothetical protein